MTERKFKQTEMTKLIVDALKLAARTYDRERMMNDLNDKYEDLARRIEDQELDVVLIGRNE